MQESKALVALSDVGVQFLQQQFQRAFDETNREVTREYSNVYVNSFPGVFSDWETKVSVNLVQVGELERLADDDVSSTLKMTRLDLQFAYELRYKSLASQKKTYQAEVLLTNDLNVKTELQIKLTKKVNDLLYPELVKFKEIDDSFLRTKMEQIYEESMKFYRFHEIFTGVSTLILNPLAKETIQNKLNIKSFIIFSNLCVAVDGSAHPLELDFNFLQSINSDLKVSEIKTQFLNEIDSHPQLRWLNNDKYEIKIQFELSKIQILGLKLSEQRLNNPDNLNEILQITVAYSANLLKSVFKSMIDYIVHFFWFLSSANWLR